MKLGAPIDLTPEELVLAGGQGAPRPPQLGQPIDALDDFEVYNAVEDEKEARGYDPADPGIAAKLWSGVKGVVGSIPSAAKGLTTLAGAGIIPGGGPAAAALASQTAGKALAGYSTLGHGAATVVQKGINAVVAVVNPELAPEMKKLSRRASWDFQREAREAEAFSDNFNQHLETVFPRALAGLGGVPVDNEAANGLSMVADPANYVPAGAAARGALRLSLQVPLRGAVQSAKVATREAALDLARASAERESATLLLKPNLDAASRAHVRSVILDSGERLRAAKLRHEQAKTALGETAAAQRAVVDALAFQPESASLAAQGAGLAASASGRVLEGVGAALQKMATVPERLAQAVAGGADDAARQSIARGVENTVGLVGVVPAATGAAGVTASAAGRNLAVFGRMLAEAEGQLPFFKRLARETTGLTSYGASLVDQSGLGQIITPAARITSDATRGLPMAAATGYAQAGGEMDGALQAMGGGAVFGMAGSGFGQWQRHADGTAFRQRQNSDIARYRRALPTDEVRQFFDRLPTPDRGALATMQLAHPDLRIQYSRLGKDRPSFYYAAEDGPVAVVNLDTRDTVPAVLAHEIGHHVERHKLGPVIERTLFGDPLLEQPGLFTQLDAEGKPVKSAEGAYALGEEWAKVRETYNSRLQALADKTGEVVRPRTDAEIGREVFAEHVADYLTGRDGAFRRDLSANVWTRAIDSLADSSLLGSGMMRQALGKLGLPLAVGDKRVVGSALFDGGVPGSKELRKVISDYHRKSARDRSPAMADEPGGTRYTAAEVQQHPQILEKLFDGSDDVKRDRLGRVMRDKAGLPIFTTRQEQATQRAELARAIEAKLAAAPPEGARFEKVVDSKTGKAEEGWVTPAIPDAVLDELGASGKFNPVQIGHLRAVSNLIREGRGGSALFFYQPALNAGKKYASLAGDWRTETPYAIFISKAGNVLLRTMSREKLVANAQELIAKGRGGPWGADVGALVGDVDRYLANHAAGKPGADGIGVEKRDQINALFGIGTKLNQSANPLIESSPRAPVVIRSRRIDRTNRLTPVEQYFPTNYDKLNANLRPEG